MSSPASVKRVGIFSETFPPKPTWDVKDVPDLTGQTILVTGGSSGIGKEMSRVLVAKNARVYIAARSEHKSLEAIEDIKASTGKTEVFFLKLDLGDLRAVREAAEEFMRKESELHVLVNNGGVMSPPMEEMTAQGYDLQFGTNVLGHFFFTSLLLPILRRTATNPHNESYRVRVVVLSSSAHMFASEGIVWETLQKGDLATKAREAKGHRWLYGQSKLGNILVAKELARRFGDQGIVTTSVHPGSIVSDMQRHLNPIAVWIMRKLLGYPLSMGIITPLFAATAPETLEMNGEYFTCWARRSIPWGKGCDQTLSARLWDWCEEQVKGF